jgi:hypothetical protein
VAGFHPPFDPVPLSDAFVREHHIRRIALRKHVDTEDARLRDVDVVIYDYDREGRLLSETTLLRGEPDGTRRFSYQAGRRTREVHEFPNSAAGARRWT